MATETSMINEGAGSVKRPLPTGKGISVFGRVPSHESSSRASMRGNAAPLPSLHVRSAATEEQKRRERMVRLMIIISKQLQL